MKNEIYPMGTENNPVCLVCGMSEFAQIFPGDETTVSLELGILRPDLEFSIKKAEDETERAKLVKSIIYGIISEHTKTGFDTRLSDAFHFVICEKNITEGAFILRTLFDLGQIWQEYGPQTPSPWYSSSKAKNINYKLILSAITSNPNYNGLRRVGRTVEQPSLYKKMILNPIDAKPYVWTKEDVNKAEKLLTDDHWIFRTELI